MGSVTIVFYVCAYVWIIDGVHVVGRLLSRHYEGFAIARVAPRSPDVAQFPKINL
jgi:hypothetical protein